MVFGVLKTAKDHVRQVFIMSCELFLGAVHHRGCLGFGDYALFLVVHCCVLHISLAGLICGRQQEKIFVVLSATLAAEVSDEPYQPLSDHGSEYTEEDSIC